MWMGVGNINRINMFPLVGLVRSAKELTIALGMHHHHHPPHCQELVHNNNSSSSTS